CLIGHGQLLSVEDRDKTGRCRRSRPSAGRPGLPRPFDRAAKPQTAIRMPRKSPADAKAGSIPNAKVEVMHRTGSQTTNCSWRMGIVAGGWNAYVDFITPQPPIV